MVDFKTYLKFIDSSLDLKFGYFNAIYSRDTTLLSRFGLSILGRISLQNLPDLYLNFDIIDIHKFIDLIYSLDIILDLG